MLAICSELPYDIVTMTLGGQVGHQLRAVPRHPAALPCPSPPPVQTVRDI